MFYENIKKVYGPYFRKDGRQHVLIYFKDGTRKTVSYPKWIMENHIKRILNKNETVDHQDRDFTNNDLSNLIIRDKSEHSKLDAKRVKKIEIVCVWCGTRSFKEARDLDHNAKLGKVGPFCSKKCTGYYGKSVELGNKHSFSPRLLSERKYYKLEKPN